MRVLGMIGVSGFVLAACAGPGPNPGADGLFRVDECDARSQRQLVGKRLDDLAAVSAAAPKVRFISPGDVVAADNQPDRLNVELDGSRVVTRVYCG